MTFYLFVGQSHCECGGMMDFQGNFETLDDAKKRLSWDDKGNLVQPFPNLWNFDGKFVHWAHIATVIDEKLTIVAELQDRPSATQPGYLDSVWVDLVELNKT